MRGGDRNGIKKSVDTERVLGRKDKYESAGLRTGNETTNNNIEAWERDYQYRVAGSFCLPWEGIQLFLTWAIGRN